MMSAARFSAGIAAALTLTFAAGAVAQGGYPARPVRIIVPLAPGGNVDIVARSLAQQLTDSMRSRSPRPRLRACIARCARVR